MRSSLGRIGPTWHEAGRRTPRPLLSAPPPALVSAVPSIIFRVGFWGSAGLNVGLDPGTYLMVAFHSLARHSAT
jgi:hypothetical protein